MATRAGPAAHTVEQKLKDSALGFDFFQAVRMLECAFPTKSRVGRSEHPRDDPVRFCQDPSLAFAPSAIARYVPSGAEGPARMFVAFMGLLGPNGALPLHITAYLHDRVLNHGDSAMVSFIDLFTHRMVSLFYRAWAAGQQTLSRDRPRVAPSSSAEATRRGDDDTFDRYVDSLFGIGMDSYRDADSVPDEAKRRYAGHLACQTKSAEGLEAVIRGYFGVTAGVVEFVGRWMTLADEHRCRLGMSRHSEALGASAVLGARIWDCRHKLRIRLGPMALGDYERLLPRTSSFRRLVDWVRNYLGDVLIWDAQLVLRADEVPRTRLGSYGRLGWTTWLASRPFDADAGDLVVGESEIQALVRGRVASGSSAEATRRGKGGEAGNG